MPIELLPNRYYHIYNRGNNREKLFYKQGNYSFFLQRYHKYCYPVLETYAFCLMSNHFHFLVRVRSTEETLKIVNDQDINLKKPISVSKKLSNLMNSYAQAINKQEGRVGSLFQKNFKRKEVDSEEYFRHLVRYIHWNPQLHKFVDDFKEYPNSSWGEYQFSDTSGTILNTQKTVQLFGGLENFMVAHSEIPDQTDLGVEFS